jgi:integrase
LEQTKAGLRFKPPKTARGRRTISIPTSVINALRDQKRLLREQRLALGLGKDTDDGLVFRHPDGTPLLPHSISTQWRRTAQALGFKVTLHAWRHTHASQLIASGMDVLFDLAPLRSWLALDHPGCVWSPDHTER